MKLNLGSSDRHFPGYVNVDVAPPADQLADLAGPWPWEDSSVDEIRAWDIIEHIGECDHVSPYLCQKCTVKRCGRSVEGEDGKRIVLVPSVLPFPVRHWRGQIHVMNEAWRVLRKGGILDIEVPTTDGPGAWQDPQHVTFWNRNSFLYYTAGDAHRERFGDAYGVAARFRVVAADHVKFGDVVKLKIKLEAVKP